MKTPLPATWRAIAPPEGLRAYTVIMLIDTLGTGMFLAGSIIYFKATIGLSAQQIGFGLSLAMFVGLLAPVPAGRVGDRFGHRGTLAVLNIGVAVAFASYPFVRDYIGFLVVASGVSLLQAAAGPTRRAVLSQLIPADQRVRSSAYIRSVANVGFTVGTAATGGVILIGTNAAMQSLVLANSLSYLVAALLILRLKVDQTGRGEAHQRQTTARAGSPYKDRSFLTVSVLSGLLMTHESLLAVAVPLYVLETGGQPWLIPAALFMNTVLAITLQVPASRGAEGYRGGSRALIRAATALVACCAVFAVGRPGFGGWLVLVVALAMLLLTAGELFSAVGAWSVSYALSDGPHQGEYLGVFSTVQLATAIAGPAAMAHVVQHASVGWACLGAVYGLLGVLVAISTRRHNSGAEIVEADPVST